MSEIDKNIDQANKLGNLLNSWTKIFIGLGIAVVSCAMAYYEIYENKDGIVLEKKERIQNEAINEERGEKRYARAMETAKELKDFIRYQQEEIVKTKEDVAYLKGYIDAMKEYRKNN